MRCVESVRYAYTATKSLFNDKPEYASVRRRPILFEIASLRPKEPLQREEGLLDKFISISCPYFRLNVNHKNIQYWNNEPYDYIDAFGTAIQFIDQHKAPLPRTSLPPKGDVEKFINTVMMSSGPVPVDKQFDILLNISKGSVTGAANIGMLATRYMSRFSEFRAYPIMQIQGSSVTKDMPDEDVNEIMRKWSNKISRFELYTEKSGRNDGTGDQYYFWTHFFAATLFDPKTAQGSTMQKVFNNGNEIMIFVKNRLAKRGTTVSNHFEAAQIGRQIGLALSHLIDERSV